MVRTEKAPWRDRKLARLPLGLAVAIPDGATLGVQTRQLPVMTDAAQFEAFMRQYQNMVYTVAYRLLNRDADAQDIAQEVFLKAYERFSELRDSPTAGGWLRKVATNMSLNHLSRYRARWRFFSEMTLDDGESEKAVDFVAPDSVDPAASLVDERALIEAALSRLPDAQRVPLVLYHFEDFSYEEIAAQLKASLSKIKTDIHRGREALRKKLRVQLADDPIVSAGVNSGRTSGAVGMPKFES